MKKAFILIIFTVLFLFTLPAEIITDDTPFEDAVTTEFCLINSRQQKFCVYHSVKNIKDFDSDIGNLNCCAWNHKDYMDLTVYWYVSSSIARAYTTSSEWKTKRGIKVGDPLIKVREVYGSDGQLYLWDEAQNKSKKVTDKDSYLYMIFDHGDDEGINISAANMREEEMMSLGFYAKNGIITKIDIRCGEMDWESYDKEHSKE